MSITEFQGEYRWLSNFAPCTIRGREFDYPSVEHAYMSAKCNDRSWKADCASNRYTAAQIKKMSRQVTLRPDWDSMKVLIMMYALDEKFHQEPYQSLLLATGDLHIQEGNWWNDKYWGVCLKTNQGLNTLGKLIMQIRAAL